MGVLRISSDRDDRRYPASRGWLLAFTKSFAWRVCRVVGFLYWAYKASQLRDRQATRRTLLTLKAMHERNLCSQGTSKISLGAKIWLVFFFWWLLFKWGFFGGSKNNLKICGSARVSRPRQFCEYYKYNRTCFAFWKFFKARKFDVGFFCRLILGAEIFWVVVGTPRDFFDFCTHSITPDHHIPAFSQAILPL